MNYKSIVSAIMIMSLSLGNLAYAQYDRRDDNRGERGRQDQNNDRRDDRGGDRRDDRGHQEQHSLSNDRDARNTLGPRFDEGSHNDRQEMQRHRFQRGDRLPPEYRGRQYVVEDWREHHLSAPPRGYHWVQSGGDYVLAAVATGIILQVLLNN